MGFHRKIGEHSLPATGTPRDSEFGEALQAAFAQQLDAYAGNLKKAIATGRKAPVHDFRVAVKRLRAYVNLVDETSSEARGLRRRLKPLKRRFREAALLRELQVQQSLLGKHAENLGWPPAGYRSALNADAHRAKKAFRKSVRNHPKSELEHLGEAFGKAIRRHSETHWIQIAARRLERLAKVVDGLALAPRQIENAHLYRKRLKELRYLLEVLGCDVHVIRERIIPDLELREDKIGDWHDLHVLGSHFGRWIAENPAPDSQMKMGTFSRALEILARKKFTRLGVEKLAIDVRGALRPPWDREGMRR